MRRFLRALVRSPAGLLGTVVLLAFILAALLGPDLLGLPNPVAGNLRARLQAPGFGGHLLGTDQLGRDMLSRIVWAPGSRWAWGRPPSCWADWWAWRWASSPGSWADGRTAC